MGITNSHALGRNLKFFCVEESTPFAFEKPGGADAAKCLSASFTREVARTDRTDARQTRSVLERIEGRATHSWSTEHYLLPSGAAGTAPDVGPMLEALMGTETVNASTSVVYSLSASQTLKTLTLQRHANDVLQENLVGAVVDSCTISGDGSSEPRITFEGRAANYGFAAAATTDGSQSSGASSIDIASGDERNLKHPCVVQVDSDDNSGAGYEVTSSNYSTRAFGISPNLGSTVSGEVLPFAPTETTAGSPVAGIAGQLLIDSNALPITAYEVTINGNVSAVEDEAFQQNITDYIPGNWEITGSFTVRCRADVMLDFAKRESFTTRDIELDIGTTAGSIVQIDIDQAEIEFGAIEMPEDAEGTFTLPFKALGSSGEDDITITFK